MKTLNPLCVIQVPPPRPDEAYELSVLGNSYRFIGLKQLLGAADHSKAGDRNAGLSAPTELHREAARSLLSGLTLQHLYDRPLTDTQGEIDAVMRVGYDIDTDYFTTIADLTLGATKNRLLAGDADEIKRIGQALTPVMVAGLAKLMDTHELTFISQKTNCPTKARTHLGQRGTLSSRLQPNHPVDDFRGVSMLVYAGLSVGAGDALIGINPAIDTVDNVGALLTHLDKLRRQTGAPTQICVLSHVKTQLACLDKGLPVEIMFQSLAGTESTNLTEFDISVELLDSAYDAMTKRGSLKSEAEQFMYFETGQGSEFTYGKHNGIDMATAEALCYGLARRYDPFMVNNVTGFIGPETHLDNFEMIVSNLQDHFMGKLMGLPMGMAPCYTLHSQITLDGQQMATQLLAAAGANFYMDVHLNTDRMLAYFDTSGHDDQTLREIYKKTPTPEYFAWGVARGIFVRGPNGEAWRGPQWGNARQFCASDAELKELTQATPALYGAETAGPRPADSVSRMVRLHQAAARAAIYTELDADQLNAAGPLRRIRTKATSKAAHLNAPHLGASLDERDRAELLPTNTAIEILVSDGLSAAAVHANVPEILPVLLDGFASKDLQVGTPLLAQYGRVKLAEAVATALQTKLVVLLIGERPGGDAHASTSLSAYLVYRLHDAKTQKLAATFSGHPDIQFEYSVISNIYGRGVPPVEAASLIVEKCLAILDRKAAGNRLEAL